MEFSESNKWEGTLAQSDREVGFLQNSIVQMLLIFAVMPIIGCVGLLVYFIRPSEASIVIHYNVYFGVDLLGLWWQTYALPILGVLFIGGHFLLARRFYERAERIACYLMLFSSGLLSFGVLIASMSIAFINY